MLYRRVDLEDIVTAHLLALERAPSIGFGRYVISATTPFARDDLMAIRDDLPAVVRQRFPDYEEIYAARGWRMFPSIERVYVNERARRELGWAPRYDFAHALERLGDKRGPAQRARAHHRREGLPRRLDRRLHRALNLARGRGSRAGGSPSTNAARTASAARRALSSSRAWTSASGRPPGSTRSPSAATSVRPTLWSTTSSSRARPPPRLTIAIPTARTSIAETTPAASGSIGRIDRRARQMPRRSLEQIGRAAELGDHRTESLGRARRSRSASSGRGAGRRRRRRAARPARAARRTARASPRAAARRARRRSGGRSTRAPRPRCRPSGRAPGSCRSAAPPSAARCRPPPRRSPEPARGRDPDRGN